MTAGARDYVPISHTFPSQKPLMDAPLTKRRATAAAAAAAAASAPDGDALRVRALKSQAAKRQRRDGDDDADGDADVVGDAGGGEPPLATDFSAFNQQLRRDREQQHSQQQQPPPLLRTFDDLTSARLPERTLGDAEQLEGLLTLDALQPACTSRDAAPRMLERSASAFDAALAAAGDAGGGAGAAPVDVQQQQQQQQRFDLPGMDAAPWDWSLKTRVRLTSAAPLRCVQAAAEAGLGPAVRVAARGAAAAAPSSSSPAFSPSAAAERLQQALMQWQHPAAPLEPDALAALHASRATAPLVAARVAAWRHSFRCLFSSLRHGELGALYVVSRPATTALFLRGGGDGGELRAVVTRVSKPLVQALAAAGVAYAVRAPPSHAAAAPPPGGAPTGLSVGDGSRSGGEQLEWAPNAQLLVRGARHVAGLHLALLQMPWAASALQPDVPLLLAPAPFPGASLTQLQLRALPSAAAGAGAAAAAAAAAALPPRSRAGGAAARPPPPPALHYAECAGQLLAPWSLQRLLRAVADAQHSDGAAAAALFDAHLDTEPCSAALNLPDDAWEEANYHHQDAAAAAAAPPPPAACGQDALPPPPPQGRGLTDGEREAWRRRPRELHGRVLKQLRYEPGGGGGGGAAVRVSARLAFA